MDLLEKQLHTNLTDMMRLAIEKSDEATFEWLLTKEADTLCADYAAEILKMALRTSTLHFVKTVMRALSLGPVYNFDDGITTLHWAVLNQQHRDVDKFLLDSGIAPNAATVDGRTPIDFFVSFAHAENPSSLKMLDLLKEHGAEILPRHFVLAAMSQRAPLLQWFEKQGFSLECRDDEGSTPLLAAVRWNPDSQVAAHLIHKGAALDALKTDGQQGVWELSLYNENPQVPEYLFGLDDAPSVFDIASTGRTFFQEAILNGKPGTIRMMDRRRKAEELKLTVDGTSVQALKTLLDMGYDVNTVLYNNRGTNLLMYACATSSYEVVNLLLSRGANIYAQDSSGRNILHYAACNTKSCESEDDISIYEILSEAQGFEDLSKQKDFFGHEPADSLTQEMNC